jgi:hypothetical protein
MPRTDGLPRHCRPAVPLSRVHGPGVKSDYRALLHRDILTLPPEDCFAPVHPWPQNRCGSCRAFQITRTLAARGLTGCVSYLTACSEVT